jgi:SAM-dependent methyltransferase
VPAGDRVMHLWLPSAPAAAGEIAISTAQGKTLVDRQPLPSGILPHGSEGNRLLETWDADYRGPKPPAWDIGRPADELKKIVNEGKVHKCRAVDLCCGSGTDAIFLAGHGFDVTAVDVAPTALAQAKLKADRAGVSVRWVLADVLNPPSLEPFDFLYDRGCYHVVRDQNLAAYLETIRRLSQPGSQFLLVSARREEQAAAGSPGVTEEELRYDFLPMFDVEWLRAIRLESKEPGSGPPGWCALLRRSAKP